MAQSSDSSFNLSGINRPRPVSIKNIKSLFAIINFIRGQIHRRIINLLPPLISLDCSFNFSLLFLFLLMFFPCLISFSVSLSSFSLIIYLSGLNLPFRCKTTSKVNHSNKIHIFMVSKSYSSNFKLALKEISSM